MGKAGGGEGEGESGGGEKVITDKQVAERIHSIGSSDAAAVLGLSRWKTPLGLWAEKTGKIPPKDLSDSLAVEVGTDLEDLVCRLFTKRTGKTVNRVRQTLVHPIYKFITANLDRRVVGEDALLEAKVVGWRMAKEWEGDDIPQEYIVQVLHQLLVSGKQRAYIAVLIGGNQKFVWKTIERDEKLIADMLKKEVHFWREFVEKKVMPSSIKWNDSENLYNLFPVGDESEAVELGDEANKIIEGLDAFKGDVKVCEANIDRLENELKALLKDKTFGRTDLYKISWKNQITQRLDVRGIKENEPAVWEKWAKSSGSRVLRINKTKQNGEEQ